MMKKLNPLCSCTNHRRRALVDNIAFINRLCSRNGVAKNYPGVSHLGQLTNFSTTVLCSRAPEVGVTDGFAQPGTETNTREKRPPKKGKLIKRKPTTTQTDQRVCIICPSCMLLQVERHKSTK